MSKAQVASSQQLFSLVGSSRNGLVRRKYIMIISSHSNPEIKKIRNLQNRKERERTGLAYIEGIRIVAEAVNTPETVTTLIIAPELLTSPFGQTLIQTQKKAGIPCLEVTANVFQHLSSKDGPQGIAAIIRQKWEPLAHLRLSDELCWVALDAIQDPGNLGTILRTCDAVGCTGVILIGQTTDPYDPTALRASMGAIFLQRLIKTTFEEFIAWKRKHNYLVIGTSTTSSTDYQAMTYRSPLVLLMGSERLGLSEEQQAACDALVHIPMVGQSDSLNLAVATGITLYEIFNQHRRACGAL
jgi:RNA methyltransferase, TrmH family